MTTIIKTKGDTIVCLRSEVEKPNYHPYEYVDSWHKQWLASFKEYPIRKEDEDRFKVLLKDRWANSGKYDSLHFKEALSKGIEIDVKLVKIEECKVPYKDGSDKFYLLDYAVLVSPEEEVSEDDWNELRNMFYYLENNGDKDATLFNEIKSKFTITSKTK